jgi:hypothetical protein
MNTILKTPLCTPSQLIDFTLCDKNIKEEYLLRAIQLATDGDLTSCIGVPLLNSLKWLIANNKTNDFQDELLDSFIRPFLCWKALKIATVDMSFKLNNSGIYSNADTNKDQADFNIAQRMAQTYETNASGYLMRLTRVLCDCSKEITDTIATVLAESNNEWWMQLNFYCSKTPLQII